MVGHLTIYANCENLTGLIPPAVRKSLVFDRGLFAMVDYQHLDGSFLGLQLEPELGGECLVSIALIRSRWFIRLPPIPSQ